MAGPTAGAGTPSPPEAAGVGDQQPGARYRRQSHLRHPWPNWTWPLAWRSSAVALPTHDVLAWLEAQGHRIKRRARITSRSNACCLPNAAAPETRPTAMPGRSGCAEICSIERFTSPAWLDECGWNDGGLPPQRRDMRGAAATLDRLRALRRRIIANGLAGRRKRRIPNPTRRMRSKGRPAPGRPPLPTPGSPTRHPHETRRPTFRRGPPARGSDRKAALRRLSQAPDLAAGRIRSRIRRSG